MKGCSQQKLKTFMKSSLLVLIQILETQTDYLLPDTFYCLIVIVYYVQVFSNVCYYTQSTNIFLKILSTIAQISTITQIIGPSKSPILAWTTYFIFHIVLYGFFILLFYLAYLKEFNPIKFTKKRYVMLFILLLSIISQMFIQFYNTFQTLFVFFLFEAYIQLNFGILFKGPYTLIQQNEVSDSNFTYAWVIPIVIIGLLFSFLLASMNLYFFRNFEFHDSNLFKRKYSPILFVILITRFLTTLFLYLQIKDRKVYLHIFAHSFGVLSLYDCLIVKPFLNQTIQRIYIFCSFAYATGVAISSLYEFSSVIHENNYFYTFLWLGPLVSYAACFIYDHDYANIMLIKQ